jgi:type I restriction enzyme M protein
MFLHGVFNADIRKGDTLGDPQHTRGGEFYTPSEVVKLLVTILKPQEGMRVYDPTIGSGGMLIQTKSYVAEHGQNSSNLSLYGQEMNLNTWAICKMNMFLHNEYNAKILKGDTLGNPQHIKGGELMTFDRVIANPPFSLKGWGKETADNDPYGRFP